MNKLKVFFLLSCLVISVTCQDEEDEYANELCFKDPNCHRDAYYCPTAGCCAYKTCNENGECQVQEPNCKEPEMQVVEDNTKPELSDEACFDDPECHRDVIYCIQPGCCGTKTCPGGGRECQVIMPMCEAPAPNPEPDDNNEVDPSPVEEPEESPFEEPKPELSPESQRTCLNDEGCHESVTYCPVENCCAYKQCNSEGECTKTMSQCYKERYDDLNDNDCFWEENCYRNIKSCSQDGCCGFKTCEKGRCSVAIPSCAPPSIPDVPEDPVIADTSNEGNNGSTDPSDSPKKIKCKKGKKNAKKSSR